MRYEVAGVQTKGKGLRMTYILHLKEGGEDMPNPPAELSERDWSYLCWMHNVSAEKTGAIIRKTNEEPFNGPEHPDSQQAVVDSVIRASRAEVSGDGYYEYDAYLE